MLIIQFAMRRAYKRTTPYGRRGRSAMYSSRRAARSLQLRAYRGAQAFRALQSAPRRSTAEVKLVDNINASAGISLTLNSTAQITCINLVQSGSGFFNRVGRRIEMQSIQVTGEVNQTETGTLYNDYARILVIYDRQTNGALPSYATIMASYDQSGTASTNYLSGVNPDERERFLVLMDQRLVLPSCPGGTGVTGATDGPAVTFNINRFIKMRNLTTHFKADSSPAVIGDVATGSVYLIGIGRAASGAEGWQANLNVRIRYKDT